MTKVRVANFFWLAIFCLVVSATARSQERPLTLSGFVREAGTDLAIENATVSAAGNLARSDTLTDSEGKFVLELSSSVHLGADIRLRIHKNGYVPYEKLVAVSEQAIEIFLKRQAEPSHENRAAPAPLRLTLSVVMVAEKRAESTIFLLAPRVSPGQEPVLYTTSAALFVRMVNLTSKPVVIDAYRFEIEEKDGSWAPLKHLNTRDSTLYAAVDLKDALEVIFPSEATNALSQPIGEELNGWLLFQYIKDGRVDPKVSPPRFRFWFLDRTGHEFTLYARGLKTKKYAEITNPDRASFVVRSVGNDISHYRCVCAIE